MDRGAERDGGGSVDVVGGCLQCSRVVFMGTAELAATCLDSLLKDTSIDIVGVVTQPDRPRGRAMHLLPGPVKVLALEHGLRVLQPVRAKDSAFVNEIALLKPDVIVVAAYGQILPGSLLAIPKYGCVNVHTSLLPKYRGAAPIQWAIANGDRESGVTLMRIVEELDAGDILAQRATPIGAGETGQELHDRLAAMGGEMLLEFLPQLLRGEMKPVPQPAEGVSYARKICKADGRIDWSLTSEEVFNRFRAFTPWPGSMTWVHSIGKPWLLKVCLAEKADGDGEPGTILAVLPDRLRVACGRGALDLLEVQREGGKRLAVAEFLRGVPIAEGTRLVSLP